MDKIKKIIVESECRSCGAIVKVERLIILDEFLKKIELPKNFCSCRNKKNFKVLNLFVEDGGYNEK